MGCQSGSPSVVGTSATTVVVGGEEGGVSSPSIMDDLGCYAVGFCMKVKVRWQLVVWTCTT